MNIYSHMKHLIYISSIFLATQLMAQSSWEKDFHATQAQSHFESASALYDAIDNGLHINEKLADLDTSIHENRIVHKVLMDQKKLMLRHALLEYEKVIETYPENFYFNLSLQSKGDILIELNELDRARLFFTKLLQQDLPFERDLSDENDSHYKDFKNIIYLNLAEIEYLSANYSQAIVYLDLAEEYRNVIFCNGMYKYHEKEVATNYAKNYFALGDHQKAIDLVMPHILTDGHFPYEKAVSDAIKYLLQDHNRSYLIEEFKSAIKNSSVDYAGGSATYSINYLGHKLRIYTSRPQRTDNLEEELLEVMENEYFYRQLIKEARNK